jgi:hypothetical protein
MNSRKVVIFIPGYYGTTLIEPSTGRLVWGDTKEVLFGRKTLAMPIPGVKIPGAIDLFPHDLIPDKKILGGLVKEDAYDKTITFLKNLGHKAIFPVAWDWRRDPLDGVHRLHKKVLEVKNLFPDHEIILVSHSFGSLIASYYLRFGTQDYFSAKESWEGLEHFSKVVLSASPYRGLMAIFRNMHYGIKFGLNHKMQTPLAFSTFESSYYLLPPSGLDLVRDENENLHSLNLHDPTNWIKNKWGLFHESLKFSHVTQNSREEFIATHLSRAKKFHSLIDSPIIDQPRVKKKLLYLSGYGFKTVHHGVWLKNHPSPNVFLYYPKNFKKWKSKLHPDSVFNDGDSTIPDFSLELPSSLKSIETKIIKQKMSHLDSLQHIDSHKIIFDFLTND